MSITSCRRVGLLMICAIAVAAVSGERLVTAQLSVDPTAALLVDLIRVNTSNPPGNEGSIAELLAPRFKALGFEIDIVPTPEPGKSHFIARLRGDGSKRPVLLAAHADVVGVEREKWTLDPFGGVLKDGYVFGRGAIDFKGGMAVFARAALMLAEQKIPLARDVIFLAEADEEGGLYNTSWLARDHWHAHTQYAAVLPDAGQNKCLADVRTLPQSHERRPESSFGARIRRSVRIPCYTRSCGIPSPRS